MRIRQLLIILSAIGMAVFLLLNFTLIWLHGQVSIYEPNVLILVCETALLVVILGFGFFSLYENLRDVKREVKK